MARPLTSSQLVEALKKFDVNFELWPGYASRGRPGGVDVKGFMIHHTAGGYSTSDSYMRFLFEDGRPGIPGPLCNFAIDGNGKVLVGALGRSNNAGSGSSSTLSKIRAEDYDGYDRDIEPGPDNINGNDYYWGVEICYGGPGSRQIRSAQYESAVRLAAAIVWALEKATGDGWTALSVLGHKEHSDRKVDPGGFAMHDFRRDVRAKLNGEGKENMAFTKADLDTMMSTDGVIAAPKGYEGSKNKYWALGSFIRGIHYLSRMAKVATTKSIAFNTWMEERWGPHKYSPRTYWRSGYGHARAANENTVEIHDEVKTLRSEVAELKSVLADLSVRLVTSITDEQIQEVADACAEAVADGIAVEVVDELKERL